MSVKVSVTAGDIKKGQKGLKSDVLRSETCPVAVSLQRKFPEAPISVGETMAYVDHVPYVLPAFVAVAIRKFDRNRKQEPFKFEMEEYHASNPSR
jgi:hypothetical protein